MTMPKPRRSRAWSIYLRAQYRLIRILDPLIRTVWRAFGLGNVVELRVAGRRTGRERRTLVGLLRDRGTWFVGHPNGDAAWTRNLAAAGGGTLSVAWSTPMPFVARQLDPGPERDRAIAATWQHVFPGNVIYRLARRHILAAGVYFVLELTQPDDQDSAATVQVSPSRQSRLAP
jgi:deazaflavin-dependent oxidoreductase (nitroreductase family)